MPSPYTPSSPDSPTARWRPLAVPGIRGRALQRMREKMRNRATSAGPRTTASAMVLAVHGMEEVLACGGIIAQKARAGAEVTIVIVCDGATTHVRQLPRAEMRTLRADESIAAAARLGLPRASITLLGVPDDKVAPSDASVIDQFAELLARHRPEELYLWDGRDNRADSRAAAALVARALERSGHRPRAFEYPIWAWRIWPCVHLTPPPLTKGREEFIDKLAVWGASLRQLGSRGLLNRFPLAVDVSDLFDDKANALNAYVSLVDRRNDDPAWWTLGDVDRGDFGRAFFSGFELFREVERP